MKMVKKLKEATHGQGVVGEGCVRFFRETSTLAMCLVNMNFLGILGKMLARVEG